MDGLDVQTNVPLQPMAWLITTMFQSTVASHFYREKNFKNFCFHTWMKMALIQNFQKLLVSLIHHDFQNIFFSWFFQVSFRQQGLGLTLYILQSMFWYLHQSSENLKHLKGAAFSF